MLLVRQYLKDNKYSKHNKNKIELINMILAQLMYEDQEVRVVGDSDNPWWVASDVCRALDIDNNSMAVSRLDEDERGISTVDTPSGKQEMLIINESGLYSLILTSRKPKAKKFKKWITSEVIPSIRKTGEYSINQIKPNTDTALIQLALATITDKLEKLENAQIENKYLQGKLEEKETKLNSIAEASEQHPGCANVIYEPDDDLFTTSEFITLKGISYQHLHVISKRAANLQRIGTGVNPTQKRNGQLLLQYCYLREATKSVLEL